MTKSFAFIFLTLIGLSTIHSNAQIVGQKSDTIVIDRVLAVVGGHPIYQSDVESQYLQAKAMGYSVSGDLKCNILESLLVSKLLLDQAELDSIAVEDVDVEAEVKNRIQGILAEAGGNEELVTSHFNKSMLEIEKDMFDPIREQMMTQRMEGEITSTLRITPSEVQKFFKSIPEDELPIVSESIEIKQIVIQPQIPQSEIKRVQDRLSEFREQIINKEKSMHMLAVLYSEDPGSASKGGEYGFKPRGTFVPEFAQAAYKLEKGDVSRIVKTEFGYHLIELIDRRGDLINVRHILMKPKVPIETKLEAKQKLDSLANKIRSGDISFEDAAKLYSDDEKSRINGGIVVNEDPRSPNSGTTKFEPKEIEPRIMAAMASLKVGEISEPFEAQDGNGNTVIKVISIQSKTPAHRADYKQDYQFLYDMAKADKRRRMVDKWVDTKKEGMYIRIHPDFQGCAFNYQNWLK